MARTRALDYDDKRNAILQRSTTLFAEKGVDRASMSDIARECGVSKALLYHYYDSKDALLFDVIHTHLTYLDDAIAEADEAARSPEDRLRALVHQILKVYAESDDQHKVQLAGLPVLPPEMAEEIREVERRIVRRFSDVLLQINPNLNDGKPLLKPVTMSFLGMLNWVYQWFKPNGPISRDEYADLATNLILEGVKSMR